PLSREQSESRRSIARVEGTPRVAREKRRRGSRPRQDKLDRVVARRPRITQKLPAALLEDPVERLAQPVERLAKGRPPVLLPVRMQPGPAAALFHPAAHAVRATPGRALPDFHLVIGRMQRKVFAVVGQPRAAIVLDRSESLG